MPKAMSASVPKTPLLEMRNIDKSFPGVRALHGVDLTLYEGEVLALLGENGAGKSTLIKMLGGAHRQDGGTIHVAGRATSLDNPMAAIASGIGIIYQEFNLIPQLTAWENIFLGREAGIGLVRRGEERRRAQELFQQIGVAIPIDRPCCELSVAQQQIVEIAKSLSTDATVIVMDEPTAALGVPEQRKVIQLIHQLKAQGRGVIFISHNLQDIFAVAAHEYKPGIKEAAKAAKKAGVSPERMSWSPAPCTA